MGRAKLSLNDAQIAVDAVNLAGGNLTSAADQLGIRRSTLYSRLKAAEQHHNLTPTAATDAIGDVYKFKVYDSSPDVKQIWSIGDEVRTIEEAMAKAEIDTAIWEQGKASVNQYVVPMKLNRGQVIEWVEGEDGTKRPVPLRQADETMRHVVWQVRVELRRRAKAYITDALDEIHLRAENHSPKYGKLAAMPKLSDPHMYEVSLFDQHFGKLCWAQETGQNFDLRIAEQVFKHGVEDLLRYVQSFPIERILFPIGNDFVHIDNIAGTTTAGTHVDSDGRYAKIVESCFMALIHALDILSGIAPVDVLLVMGNHDKHVAYHLARELRAWYRRTNRVTVDYQFRQRKFFPYGNTLLGFTHGNTEKSKWTTLPNLMATAVPHLWANALWREWHLGHFHSKAKRETLPVEEVDGVVMRTLPSLTATDAWHYESGYYSNRCAEAYLWSKERGYAGHFSTNVREE